jgi:hypothetical protein
MLEIMRGVMILVALGVGADIQSRIDNYFQYNRVVGLFVHLLIALCIVIPALWYVVALFDRYTEGKPSAFKNTLGLILTIIWFAVSVLMPVWLLAMNKWNSKNKELFRFFVGIFVFACIVLLIWWAVDNLETKRRFTGYASWALPISTFIILVIESLLIQLSLRLFPEDDMRRL